MTRRNAMLRKSLLLIAACLLSAACGSNEGSPPNNSTGSGAVSLKESNAKHRSYQVQRNEKRVSTLAGEAYLMDEELTISFPGRAPHDLQVQMRKSITKGSNDAVIYINDLTNNTTTTFSYSEEDGASQIAFNGESVSMVVNPNNTIAVAGTTHNTVQEAAQALASMQTLAGIAPQTLAGLQEVLVDSVSMGTDSKWSYVVQIVVAYIIHVVCNWTCDIIFEDDSQHQGTCQNACGEIISGVVNFEY
jgi:hypothetical protein